MRILALDPGNEHTAWCVVENGVPVEWDKELNASVLGRLFSGGADLLAVEMIASYGMAVGKEVFDTCVWIGRFLQGWSMGGARQHRLVYRREVKLHLCESVRANDSNIRAALIDRFGPGKDKAVGTKRNPGPLFGIKGDCWAALAVALTAESLSKTHGNASGDANTHLGIVG